MSENPFSAEMALRQQLAGARAHTVMAQRCLDRIDPDRKLRDAPDLQPLAHPVIQQQREINGRNDVGLHHHGREPAVPDSTDALENMANQVVQLRGMVAELRGMVLELREEMRGKPSVVMFPSNALRHSR